MLSAKHWGILSFVCVVSVFSVARLISSPCYVDSDYSCDELLENHQTECGSCDVSEYENDENCSTNHLVEEATASYPSHRSAEDEETGQVETGIHSEYPTVQCGKVVHCSCEIDYECDEIDCYPFYFCEPNEDDVAYPVNLFATFITGASCSN